MDGVTLDREALRQWLVAKEPNEPISTHPLMCPGGVWAAEHTGHRWVAVAYHVVEFEDETTIHCEWLQDFARGIDTLDGDWPDVTAKQALEVLDSLDFKQLTSTG